jgi:hypothetical protein
MMAFEKLYSRMTKMKAIVRIARKLFNRIGHIFKK